MDENTSSTPAPVAVAAPVPATAPARAESRGGGGKIGALIIVAVLLALAVGWLAGTEIKLRRTEAVVFASHYQAVLFANGSVYYGKLEGYGTSNPVLTDVFYIVTQANPETKQTTNVLVKRGKELHGPDRMYINPNQIVFVEPVGPDSKVARLISEAH